MTAIIPILIVCSALFYGVYKKIDVQTAFSEGVKGGLSVCLTIFPNILIMLTAITIFRAAGGIELFAQILAPLFNMLGIPVETAQIVLLRPFSGSGALALGREIMETYGVESEIGKIAAVMLGASETSVYTIGVYSGFLEMRKVGRLMFCAIMADLAAFLAAVWCVRFM